MPEPSQITETAERRYKDPLTPAYLLLRKPGPSYLRHTLSGSRPADPVGDQDRMRAWEKEVADYAAAHQEPYDHVTQTATFYGLAFTRTLERDTFGHTSVPSPWTCLLPCGPETTEEDRPTLFYMPDTGIWAFSMGPDEDAAVYVENAPQASIALGLWLVQKGMDDFFRIQDTTQAAS